MLLDDLIHLFLGEYFKNRGSSEPQAHCTPLLHEECAIVDNTSFEESLNDELFFLKFSVDLNHTALKEV